MHVNSDIKQFFISLQCPYKQYIPQLDRAWHILTHWIRKTEDIGFGKQRMNYEPTCRTTCYNRKDWFLSVSESYLANLQVSAEDYIDNIGQPVSHLDLLGLFVLCCLYAGSFRTVL